MITYQDLRRAMALPSFDPAPAHLAMAPAGRIARQIDPPPREAGVLALAVPQPGDPSGALHLVLTRRTAQLNGHSGQMSFPGGRRDPSDADFWETALRETREELGIDTAPVERLGALSPLYIPPSHFDVYPWLGYLPHLPELSPSPHEVAAVYLAPLDELLSPDSKQETEITLTAGMMRRVPAYLLCGQIVWGATAAMLSELEHRLRTVL